MLCVLNLIPVFIWPLLLSLIIVITCLLFLALNGVIIELLIMPITLFLSVYFNTVDPIRRRGTFFL